MHQIQYSINIVSNLTKVLDAIKAIHPGITQHPSKAFVIIIPDDHTLNVIMEEQNDPIIADDIAFCLTRVVTHDDANMLMAVRFDLDDIAGALDMDVEDIDEDDLPELIHILTGNTEVGIKHAGNSIYPDSTNFNANFNSMMIDLADRFGGSVD